VSEMHLPQAQAGEDSRGTSRVGVFFCHIELFSSRVVPKFLSLMLSDYVLC
jgi:hypothetical protein